MSARSFVGRERDVVRLEGLLKARTRLVTIIGPAGVGKTRLAREVARRGNDCCLLELSGARSLDDLCRLLGHCLCIDLGDEPDTAAAVQRIGSALRARPQARGAPAALVVLDELEHIAARCSEALADWSAAGDSIRFLITSRNALGVPGETVYELLPLRVPAAGEAASTSPAVQLFLERAAIVRAPAPVDSQQLADVAAIVERLEGFPLAIELAAALLEAQSPAELRASLEAMVDPGAASDAGDRRSLERAIVAAWRTLDAADQEVLAAACAFRGGFTVEAVSVVAGIDADSARARIGRLRARALVFSKEVAEGVAPRWDLYDSVRRYLTTAVASRVMAAAEARHSAYFLERHGDWRALEPSPASIPALEAEQANLLAVLERSAPGQPAPRLQVAAALAPLRIGRAPLGDYVRDLDFAIAMADRHPVDASLLAAALLARGRAHALLGHLSAAALDHERALALAESNACDALLARALVQLGTVRRDLGDTELAVMLFERALDIGRRTSDPRLEAAAAGGLARVERDRGAPPEHAIELARQAVEIARRAQDLPTAARMESRLGTLLVDVGQHGEASAHFDAAHDLAASLDLVEVDTIVTINLAVLEHDLGLLPAAEARYRSALGRAEVLGLRRLEAGAALLLSLLLMATGRAGEANGTLSRALQAFEGGRDSPYAGLTHVAIGATHAAAGRLRDAEHGIETGRAILERGGDVAVTRAADVLASLLLLARSRTALAAGHLPEAIRLRNTAEAVMAEVRRVSASIVRLALAVCEAAMDHDRAMPLPIAIAPDGSFVDLPDGRRVDLGGQPQSRRILRILVDARRTSPGHAVPRDALVSAVWPDEPLDRKTGKNRLHVAMNQLRALGLRAVVLTRGGGYLLDPDTPVIELQG